MTHDSTSKMNVNQLLIPLSTVNTKEIGKTIDSCFFLERDIIGMQLLLILQKTMLQICRVAHHGEFVRSIFEGLALLDFSDLEASIDCTESTEMTDACGSCAGDKKRPVFLWQSSNGARLSGWDVDSHGFHTSFLIVACPSTWYGHITQIPRIHVLMRFIPLSFLNCALFISNHTDQSHIRNFENSNYVRTGRSCKAKCYLSKWWGLHHRQVLHLVHCLYCSHQISWTCPWCSWCTSNCAWTKSSK